MDWQMVDGGRMCYTMKKGGELSKRGELSRDMSRAGQWCMGVRRPPHFLRKYLTSSVWLT